MAVSSRVNVKVSTGSLDDIVDTYDYDIYNYNAVARITPSISIDTDGQKLKIQNFRIDINDAIRQSIGNSNNRFLGTGDNITDWELGSDSTSGFGQLRKKLSSQYVLQLSDTNWSKYGASSMPDFEVSKRNGLFHASKNGIDSDITPIDILPFSSDADL